MSTTQDIFNEFLGNNGTPEQKKAQVAQVADQKKIDLGGLTPPQSYNLGAAALEGIGTQGLQSQEEVDLLNLAPLEIIQKYGNERGGALLASKYEGIDQYGRDVDSTRNLGQATGDIANQVASGFGSALGGVATPGLGLVSDELGAEAASNMDKFNNVMRDFRSDASTRHARAMQARSDLRGDETQSDYNKAVSDGTSPVVAGLEQFGADFAGGVSDVLSDPTVATDMVAQGVGSMAAIPVLAAGTPGVVTGAVAKGASKLLGSRAGQLIGNAVAPTAAIGAVESGATYQQTVNQVMGRSFEDLKATSPEYNALLASGMSESQARTELANSTALQAAGTQLPAALAAGALVSRFEAAPTASRTLKGALQNAGKEFVEEASQSGSGQLAQNLAIQGNVDSSQDLLADVGAQAGAGAVAGMGTAAVLQGPGVVGNAATRTAQAIVGAVDEQVSKVRARNEAASPVADANVQEQAAEVVAEAPVVQESVADDPVLSQMVADITESAIQLDGDTLAQQEDLPAVVRQAAQGQTTQVGFLGALAAISTDQTVPEADRVMAQVVLQQTVEGLNAYLDEQSASLDTLDAEHPVRQFMTKIQRMNASLQASPTMAKAAEESAPLVQKAVENNPLTEENQTPEAAQLQLAASEIAPEATTQEGVNTLLKMAASGQIQLTDAQRTNLQVLSKMFVAAKEYDDAAVAAGNTSQARVSAEIKTGDTGTTDDGLSVVQHAQGIRKALQRGDLTDAKSRLEDLGLFAQHMQNKVKAINSHIQTENPTFKTAPTYQKLVGSRGNRQFVDSKSKQGVTPTSESSVRHTQLVSAEANFVTKAYNIMADSFAQLGLPQMSTVDLDARLQGVPGEVAASFTSGSNKAGATAQPTQAAPKATAKPKAEPKVVAEEPVQQAAPAETEPAAVTAEFTKSITMAAKGMDDATLDRRIARLFNDLMTENAPRKAEALEILTAERDSRVVNEAPVEPVVESAPVVEPTPAPVAEVAPVAEEAAPAVVAEPVVEDEPAAVPEKGLLGQYPNLVGGEQNVFVKSFKSPMTPISKLDGVTTPIRNVVQAMETAIDDQAALRAFKSIFADFPNMLTYTNNVLNDYLAKPSRTKKGKRKDDLMNGNIADVVYFPEGRIAALAEIGPDGIGLNVELASKAYLAGINWLLNGMSFVQSYDLERASKMLNIPEDQITEAQMEALSHGVTRVQAIDALANNIQRYWGVTTDSTVIDGYTKGIPQAMAASIIDFMTQQTVSTSDGDTTVLTMSTVDISVPDGEPRTLDIFTPISFKDTPLVNFRSAIEKIVAAEPELAVYIGDDLPPLARTQMNNPAVPNSPQQLEMLKNQNATGYTVNMQTLGAYEAMGIDAMIELFGEGVLDPAVTNRNDLVSREGRNTNIVAAWDTLKETVFSMEAQAQDDNTTLDKVQIHYGHNVTSVGRAQQLGRYTPQSSKLMRTVLLPTNSTPLDLTDPTGQDYQSYMLALGQTMGIKVHNFDPSVTMTKLDELVNGKYARVIAILQDHLNENGRAFSTTELGIFKSVLGKPTFELFQALTEYARFLNTADKSAYTTQIYLEADGMSNGPFNSMALFANGNFTPDQIKNLAKCGLYLGGDPATQNSWVQRTADSVDLYGTVSKRTKEAVGQLTQQAQAQQANGDSKKRRAATNFLTLQGHLNRMMSILIPDMVVLNDDGTIDTTRGISKNPTTIITYGSGKAGIAAKLTNAMIDNLYSMMSQALAAHAADNTKSVAQAMFPNDPNAEAKLAQLDQAMQVLTTASAYVGKKGVGVYNPNGAVPEQINVDVNYTIDRESFKMLSGNVRQMFVEPMHSAIQQTLGYSVGEATQQLRVATQVQSIVLAHAYAKRVREVLPKPGDANYVQGGYLSQKQQQDIFKSMSPLHPFITAPGQTYFIAGAEKGSLFGKVPYGASPNNAISSVPMSYAMANAGVKGIATLVIGSGDGMTIQNVSQDPAHTERALFIFDGINYPVDYITQGSNAANKAAFNAILGNPMKSVAESFDVFLTELTDKLDRYVDVTPEFMLEMVQAIQGLDVTADDIADLTGRDLMRMLSGVSDLNRATATRIQARHNVLNKVNLGMDQMAAAGSPYLVTDKIALTGTPDEVATQLNTMLTDETNKLFEEQTSLDIAIDNSRRNKKTNVADALTTGVEVVGGARVLTAIALTNVLQSLRNVVPRNQSLVFAAAQKNLSSEGYKVIHGSYEQLLAYNESLGANGVNMQDIDPVADQGVTLPSRREIWIMNPTAEVLAHEIIHASTYMSVLGHMQAKYENAEAVVSPKVAKSIDAIEDLMGQFLTLDDTSIAYKNAANAVSNALNNTELANGERVAVAVNEYMAWSLANQDLAKTQSGILAQISTLVADTLKAIRQWLFGDTKGSEDMLSSLAYHTKVVMDESQPTLQSMSSETALMQSNVFGLSERLVQLNTVFNTKISDHVNSGDRVTQAKRQTELVKAGINADFSANLFANSFPMTMQESAMFKKVVTALGTQAKIDTATLARMQELYSAALRELSVESFMADPTSNNPNDLVIAKKKFDVVMGRLGFGRDTMDRSTLLPSFMALALVNDEFRGVLSNLAVPRTLPSDQERAFDALLENQANKMLDGLSDVLTGTRHASNITQAVDALADHLIKIEQDTGGFYDQYVTPVGSYSDKINARVVEGMDRLSDKLGTFAADRRAAGKNQTLAQQAVNNAADLASAIINEEKAGLVGEAILAGANATSQLPKWLHDLVADLVGRVASNAELYDMIKKTRSGIQRLRNQFRTELPKTLAKQFTRQVTSEEWSLMHKAIGRTDLTALVSNGHMTPAQVLAVLGDQPALNRAMRTLEKEVNDLGGFYGGVYQDRALQLAEFMMTGIPGQGLQRNATAIAARVGTRTGASLTPDQNLVRAIDSLTSLYALNLMSDAEKAGIGALAQGQGKGLAFTFGYAQNLRADELSRVSGAASQARFNLYKGHMPSLNQDGVSLIVASDREFAALSERSYIRVASYDQSSWDVGSDPQSYYFAAVNGRAMFNQGILQNVRQTVSGVDSLTGYTVGSLTAGRITDPKRVARIAAQMQRGASVEVGSNLMPVYSETGSVIAFERSVDPAKLTAVNQNTNFGEVMGAWKGRLAEETLAVQSNIVSVEAMAEMFRKDMQKNGGNTSGYVNLFDTRVQDKNPVILDALKLFTPSTVDAIHSQFANGEFWVRKDMLDNVIGYRSATVGDAWTGNTYWSKSTQEAIRKLGITVFGNKAYQYMVTSESKLQDVVQDAKTLIIVKSVVVPVSNFMSNMLQLVARGVPVRSIVAGMPKKLAETRQYVASEKRAIEAEAELHATTDPIKQRRLSVEIRAIRDSYKRMSIWPLIERGELSSMSDDAQPEDVDLASGRLTQYLENQVNKLPPALRAAGKYALITKDTAIYKGLRKSVEYGDFLAKAILWDDITNRQGRDVDYANARVTEEFVNFDRLGGRTRQYLESIGLLWFYNFKIRSVKVGLSMIRNNPFHALVAASVPVPAFLGSVGSPITDNLFSQIAEGGLGHSIGLDQLVSAPMMHPIENALF